MKIDVYTLTYNEELILPYFLRYYEQFARKIVIYDNGSTDRTCQIAKDAGVDLRPFDTGGKHYDRLQCKLKSECYRESRGQADWVIVVDCDEFIWHPNLVGQLEQFIVEGITLPKVKGYDMVSPGPPFKNGQIFDEIPYGWPDLYYDKRSVFRPEIDINFGTGCHVVSPVGAVREDRVAQLKLLHYRFLGPAYTAKRYAERMARISEENVQNGWGTYTPPPGYSVEAWVEHCYLHDWTAKKAERVV